jgi:hypothetical protein
MRHHRCIDAVVGPLTAGEPVIKRWLAYLVAAQLSVINAHANEVCHFAGTTDYAGQLNVTTTIDTNAMNATTTVDVRGRFTGVPMPYVHLTYLMQEISTWKSDRLLRVAANSRYIVGDTIIRQFWDVFDRGAEGLEAYRLQGKSRDEFQRQHAAFASHWDPASFGQSWLQDYFAAGPDRRRDLDLPAASARPDIRSPLALAFYWSRRIQGDGEAETIFLPGFKKDKRVEMMMTAEGPPHDGQRLWQTSIRYPALSMTDPSIAQARISPDGHLLQITGAVHGGTYTAYGNIRLQGCEGTATFPPAQGG